MTSLEWRTLWQISQSKPIFTLIEGAPVIWFYSQWDGIPGNNSAAGALLNGGMVRLSSFEPGQASSHSRFPGARPVILTARGRRALNSSVAAEHRPPPQLAPLSTRSLFDRQSPAWLEHHIAGDWFHAESYCRQLWLLDLDGPAVRRRDTAWNDQGVSRDLQNESYRVPSSRQALVYVPDFVDRGYAQQREDGAVITQAGRDVLATRPDLTVVFEAERRVRQAHLLRSGTAEEQTLHNVGSNEGLYVCVCGWFLIYKNPLSRQWADEFPAAEHLSRLTDTEVLTIVRDRERL
ncbi:MULTISPECIES: hypothetical protein [Cryobacterium]|uniref:hypothetical protein n=1 Tax=Cryobacterium TaxID=69578 RepID=UPI0010571E36|nr:MULTISPECIES: hypothetical protein [Cryobacterium]TFC46030.1 hypothetical protein E3O57_07685 [Cryobacterium sp. TMN-39-2]